MIIPVRGWWHYLNPFSYLGDAAGKVAADAWTAAMLGMWNAGLWLLKLILNFEDAFLTPDLRENGPAANVYRVTFWMAGVLVIVMMMVQLGVAAFRRDGRSLARAAIGTGQFVLVLAVWIVCAAAALTACGGVTRALLRVLLHVDAMSAWQPFDGFSTDDISDGTVATVLGIMGIFLVFSAVGHALVMLARAGALMVLAATGPISAAGLVSEAGRGWFWKSLRWFIAAAFTPVLMALVLGVGVQMTSGVATGYTDDLQNAIGTAVPGVMLILIGCFCPLALFKLLAFVDPGTSSGAAMRAGLASQGGVQGLLSGGGKPSGTSDAASSTDSLGKSQAETAGEADTGQRFAKGAGGALSPVGSIGHGLASGMGKAQNVAGKAAAIGGDVSNQMGVGHGSYIPDFSTTKIAQRGSGRSGQGGTADDDNPDVNGSGPQPSAPNDAAHPTTPTGTGGASATGRGPGGPHGGGSPPGAASGAAGSGAAATVPVVPA